MDKETRKDLEAIGTKLLTGLRHRAYVESVMEDNTYHGLLEIEKQAEQAYESLSLEDSQRDIIENLLKSRFDIEEHSLNMMYLAGHLNMLLLLESMGFINDIDI